MDYSVDSIFLTVISILRIMCMNKRNTLLNFINLACRRVNCPSLTAFGSTGVPLPPLSEDLGGILFVPSSSGCSVPLPSDSTSSDSFCFLHSGSGGADDSGEAGIPARLEPTGVAGVPAA